MKQQRFHLGDTVTWDGAPNEYCRIRKGTILSIKEGIATIDNYLTGKERQVPLKILKKI